LFTGIALKHSAHANPGNTPTHQTQQYTHLRLQIQI